jgi:hypothetical protein
MAQNNIPNILKHKNWTKYRLWQELGGEGKDRNLAYGLANAPVIPPRTTWATIKRIAGVLGVRPDMLERNNLHQ